MNNYKVSQLGATGQWEVENAATDSVAGLYGSLSAALGYVESQIPAGGSAYIVVESIAAGS